MTIVLVDSRGKVLSREKSQRREKKSIEEKEKKEGKMKSFISRFSGENVEVKLTTGDVLTGIIKIDGYNKFDTILNNERGSFLIPKHGIVYIIQREEQKKE